MYVKVKGTVLKAFKMSGDIELPFLFFWDVELPFWRSKDTNFVLCSSL